jgi:hypothetical protein
MLNRTNNAVSEALDARRAITAELRERLQEVPPSPFDWSSFDPCAALRGTSDSIDLQLAMLSRLLCTAPARSAELRALWNECVITAAFAQGVAPHLGADPRSSAIAGLLHRLGDMLTIRAIAEIEYASRVRLDSASKAGLCVDHGVDLLDRVLRAWGVPARAASTAAEWRRLREFPGAAADAAAVYLARLFALELISPQFCAPGVVEHAIEELGLEPDSLSAVRSDPAVAAYMQGLLFPGAAPHK